MVFLDITATKEKRKTLVDLVIRVAANLSIPFTVGGGISSVDAIHELLKAGADKVSLNSSIVKNPELISEASQRFGAQCIVAAIDAKKESKGKWNVYVKGGTEKTDLDVLQWAEKVEALGAGEILLTSMDKDGTKSGFDLELLALVNKRVRIPVIASGGAGTIQHCIDAVSIGKADAILAASIFHFKEIEIHDLKVEMKKSGLDVRI